jgi:hypothetical protein
MAKKDGSPRKTSTKVSASVLGVGKATYERKKSEAVTDLVQQEKASRWLDLISPITEWAGLKGDALKFKRGLLRIQQEETLLRVAESVREKLANAQITQVVPRKILVPALEKASLEEATDDVMIDRWASLLASAALDIKVQPRFVGILEELAGPQAQCLERVAFNQYSNFNYPATIFEDSSLEFAEFHVQRNLDAALDQMLRGKISEGADADKVAKIVERFILYTFCRPGVLVRSCFLSAFAESYEIYDTVRDTGIRDDRNLSILESLGLIRHVGLTCDLVVAEAAIELSIYYWHLTDFGVEFCQVCSKTRLAQLEQIGEASAEKGLSAQHPFSAPVDTSS